MAQYDEAILQSFANRLYARAARITVEYVLGGAAIGAFIGYMPVIAWYWRDSTTRSPDVSTPMWVAAIVFAVVGFVIGQAKAFDYKFRAQTVLCQLQIERNTRGRGEAHTRTASD